MSAYPQLPKPSAPPLGNMFIDHNAVDEWTNIDDNNDNKNIDNNNDNKNNNNDNKNVDNKNTQ